MEKMKAKKKVKKRAPTDSTMRNVRAANDKFKEIDQHLKALTLDMMTIFSRMDYLENISRVSSVKYVQNVQRLMRKE